MAVPLLAIVLGLSANSPSPAHHPPTTDGELWCFAVAPGIVLRREDLADIKTAVRGATGRPVRRIEAPDPSDHPPSKVFQVVTLLRGDCDNGEGQRLWIRKGRRGWRVIKHLGSAGWGTAAAGASGTVQ
jgi:hypothetical protein